MLPHALLSGMRRAWAEEANVQVVSGHVGRRCFSSSRQKGMALVVGNGDIGGLLLLVHEL